jgi:hypothetical protein
MCRFSPAPRLPTYASEFKKAIPPTDDIHPSWWLAGLQLNGRRGPLLGGAFEFDSRSRVVSSCPTSEIRTLEQFEESHRLSQSTLGPSS